MAIKQILGIALRDRQDDLGFPPVPGAERDVGIAGSVFRCHETRSYGHWYLRNILVALGNRAIRAPICREAREFDTHQSRYFRNHAEGPQR